MEKKNTKSNSPEWLELDSKEIEQTILEIRGQDMSSSEIGLILRDRYGVPDVKLVTGKKITQILREKNVEPKVPEDLQNLITRALGLKKHLDINPKDVHNKRALQLIESKIRRLVKYYKNNGKLPEDWIYDLKTAEILISR
ncbi:MAG: 30S ribosomal protein S15 [Methanocellales archaeon]|nr:30S ribosomal protein S15 [Methanocellales archaeon]